ncbi:MAG TPA: TetR/AcrR family transcriptional regulator [Solirubrobacterales bacterium]|nr:TetR/AcrR family transcriptional regulator [Solirubrobacterales bacterium]
MDSSSASNPQSLGGRRALPRAYAVRSEREQLLEAMVRVAAEKGYEAATVSDVVELAGVSRATFYENFEGKEDCFLEAYDAVIDVLVAHVTTAFESATGEPWPRRIAVGLGALVELLAAEADIARMAMVEVTAAGDDARERYRAALARFTPFLEEGRTYSGQGDALPADTARFAVGGATSMIFDEIRAGRGPELQRVLPDLVFAVLMPYLGPEAAEEEMRRVTGGERAED